MYIGQNLQVAYPSYTNIDDISGSFNGVTTSFALTVGGVAPVPAPLSSNQCMISVGGVIQRPDDTGTEGFRLSGGNIVFSSAPNTGEDFFGVILAGADYVNVGGNFPSGTVSTPSITFDTDLDTGIYNPAANQLGIACAGSLVSTFTSAGQSILSGSASAPSLFVTGDTNTGIYSPGADSIAISTGGTQRATVDSIGRLLVGTSSTSGVGLLTVQGYSGSSTGEGIVSLQKGAATPANGDSLGVINFANSSANTAAQVYAQRDGGTWTSGSSHPGRLVFSTTADGASSPTERMRINSLGMVGINTSVKYDGNNVSLAVAGAFPATPVEIQQNTTAPHYCITFRNANGLVGNITTSGSATAFNTSSDYRLKENVEPVTDGITRLQQLKPSRFNFIADPSKTVDGFLAHEVQDIVPEAITGEKDAVDDDGNPIYQGIDQSKLVPLLTAALQEAVAKIETLEARLTAAGI